MLERLFALDRRLSARLSASPSNKVRIGASMAAHTGDGAPWLVMSLLITLIAPAPLRHAALRTLVTIAMCGIMVGGLKLLFRRKRPSDQHNQLYFPFDRHSFPSGHAARMAALVVILGSSYPAVALPLALWALLVTVARVVLGVHYLSDALAGLAAGTAIASVLRCLI